MNWLTAILLAVVAGITDILPVSGTAHLFLFEKLFGLHLSDATLLIYRSMVHFGLALALLLYYHHRVWEMLRAAALPEKQQRENKRRKSMSFGRRLLWLQLVSALPMFAALFLDKPRRWLEASYNLPLYLCGFFFLSGLLLYFSGRGASGRKGLQELSLEDGAMIGLWQIPTVLPGLSRGAFTTAAALLQGFDYSTAVVYSGLMGIPTFLAAGIVERLRGAKAGASGLSGAIQAVILLTTALTALLALRVLTDQASRRRPTGFAFWCWGAGIFSLILFLIAA